MYFQTKVALTSKATFYDDYVKYGPFKYNYVDMENIEIKKATLLLSDRISFFYKKNNSNLSISFNKKDIDKIKEIVEYIEEYKKNNVQNIESEIAQKEFNESNNNNLALKTYISFNVKGVSFRQDTIKKYVKESSHYLIENDEYSKTKRQMIDDYDYNEPIFQYFPLNVRHLKFEEEPENAHDENAIKILISNNNVDFYHVGYVPTNINTELKKLLHENIELNVECLIHGGKYKTLNDFDEMIKCEKDYYIEITIRYKKTD